MNGTKIAIFTKQIHLEKLVNFLNQNTSLNYIISTCREEIFAYDFDVGISYCFPHIININFPEKNVRSWYNYHPAPLPEYPGPNDYAMAIKNKVSEFGVTLHIMNEEVDKGPILRVDRFMLKSIPTNTNELGNIAHYHLFQMFKETIGSLAAKPGSKKDFENSLRLAKS